MTAPVEFTAQYATSVEDLTEAWAFVMGRIDSVGPDPIVIIKPKWRFADDENGRRFFEVVVSGMVDDG